MKSTPCLPRSVSLGRVRTGPGRTATASSRWGASWARGSRRSAASSHSRSDSPPDGFRRSEEHTSELQSLMRISYAVFCLKKKKKKNYKMKRQCKHTMLHNHEKQIQTH